MNIFKYTDYREFLKDYLNDRKNKNLPCSYRWLNQRAGFTSPNYLHLVIHGKRHLSVKASRKLAKVLQLKNNEADFFEKLIEFSKAKNLSEKENIAFELIQFKGYQDIYKLAEDQYDYYQKWYHIVIRELIGLNTKINIHEIHKVVRPIITEDQLESSINLLTKLGLIKKIKNEWTLNNRNISTGNQISHPIGKLAIVNYHKGMLDLAKRALDHFTGKERNLSSVTIGLSASSYEIAVQKIQDLRKELLILSEKDSLKNKIYQFNFQLFPLTTEVLVSNKFQENSINKHSNPNKDLI